MHHYECHHRGAISLPLVREEYAFLQGLSDESVEARYYLLAYIKRHWKKSIILTMASDGSPLPIFLDDMMYYWSISHSSHYVAFSFSDIPTGIDIEEMRDRSEEVFLLHHVDEYDMLHGKNWHSFYLLWTMKEALIKRISLTLDALPDMVLTGVLSSGEYILEFSGKPYILAAKHDDGYIFSYTLS